MSIKITKNRCPQNHPCPAVRMCPTGALSQKGFSAPDVNNSKCVDCGRCIRMCAFGVFSQQ